MARIVQKRKMDDILLEHLFYTPRPLQRHEKIYFEMQQRLFPDRILFVRFLKTHDQSERVELAKQIISRFCLDSTYPPPYQAIKILLDVEAGDSNRGTSYAYTPQDHFVHKVNLYLLGIYAFFYHKTLNRDISRQFTNRRDEETQNRLLISTKDFISSWKYFCLFHDIAYPIEIAFPNKKVEPDNPKSQYAPISKDALDSLEIFNYFPALIHKELVAEAFAKITLLLKLLSDEQNIPTSDLFGHLGYIFVNESKSKLDPAEIIAQYKNFEGLAKLYCYDNLKMLLSFIPKDEVLYVLIDKSTEIPVALMRYEDCASSKKKVVYYTKNSFSRISREKVDYCLLSEDYYCDGKYRIMYFVDSPKIKLQKGLLDKLSVDHDNLLRAIDYVERNGIKQTDVGGKDYYRIETAQDLSDYLYSRYLAGINIFETLFAVNDTVPHKWFIPDVFYDQGTAISEKQKQIIEKYLKNELSNIVSKSISKNLSAHFDENMRGELMNELHSEKEPLASLLSAQLKSVLSNAYVASGIEMASKEASESIHNELKDRVVEVCAVINILLGIAYRLDFKQDSKSHDNFATTEGFDCMSLLQKCEKDKHINSVLESIRSRFRAERGVELEDLMACYQSKHARYDHGLCSGLFHLYTNAISCDVIEAANTSVPDRSASDILRLIIWDADADFLQQKLFNNYHFVIEQTAYSILCHNIFADRFFSIFKKKWITTLNKSPFAYFCILMDSLQMWNRPQYIKHSARDLKPEFSHSDYEIHIDADKINVIFLSNIKNFEKIKKDRIDLLDSFLADCTNYISLSIKHIT